MNSFTIHPAVESDVPILLAMIGELAEFERLTHELEVSATSLRAALFGERSVAGALIAHAKAITPATLFTATPIRENQRAK